MQRLNKLLLHVGHGEPQHQQLQLAPQSVPAGGGTNGKGLKVFISVDIEGVAGAAHWDEASSAAAGEGEYHQLAERMTAEAVAAAEGGPPSTIARALPVLARNREAGKRD